MSDPYELARLAGDEINRRAAVDHHDVAVVLGSGWAPAADRFGEPVAEVPMAEVVGFAAASVAGHAGTIRSIASGDRQVLVLAGRVHAYEGHDLAAVVHGVRAAVMSGCSTVVLTNASGGINPDFAVGQPVLICDHVDLTGRSPLTGPNPDAMAPRFPDLSDCWSERLRTLARRLDPTLAEAVYAGVNGPQYETPAEIRMMQVLGADLVGMSTVHEAVAAHHLGAEILGVSLVTNAAAGLGEPLDHDDVIAAAGAAAARMGGLLSELVAHL